MCVLAARTRPCAALTCQFRLFKTQKGRCAPPTPPVGAPLILPAKLMIFRENPAKNKPGSSGKSLLLSFSKHSAGAGAEICTPSELRCTLLGCAACLLSYAAPLKYLCCPGGYTISASLSGQHGLILTAILMMNRENPAKGLGKNPRKITPSHLVQ